MNDVGPVYFPQPFHELRTILQKHTVVRNTVEFPVGSGKLLCQMQIQPLTRNKLFNDEWHASLARAEIYTAEPGIQVVSHVPDGP